MGVHGSIGVQGVYGGLMGHVEEHVVWRVYLRGVARSVSVVGG